MGPQNRVAKPLLNENGERIFVAEHLKGRFIVNLSKCPVFINPETSKEVVLHLLKHNKTPIKSIMLNHFEHVWIDHNYFIPTSSDGRRVVLPFTFQPEGVRVIKQAFLDGKIKA